MTIFSGQVESWRQLVEAIVSRQKPPFDPNLVLAVIQQESGGRAGVRAGVGAGDGSHASGLMQCIGSVVTDYNSVHKSRPCPAGAMTDGSLLGSAWQVEVGVWLLARKHSQVRAYAAKYQPDYPLDSANRTLLADCAYAMGWAALRSKLDTLRSEGKLLTFGNLRTRFPDWGKNSTGKWINRPLHHATVVYGRWAKADREHHYEPTWVDAIWHDDPFAEIPSDNWGSDSQLDETNWGMIGVAGVAVGLAAMVAGRVLK